MCEQLPVRGDLTRAWFDDVVQRGHFRYTECEVRLLHCCAFHW